MAHGKSRPTVPRPYHGEAWRSEVHAEIRGELHQGTWSIPPERMKMRRPHDVPLSTKRSTCSAAFGTTATPRIPLNPLKAKPLCENALNSALRRMGYTKEEMTSHGFRSSASTILNEHEYNPDVIETALGHLDQNEVRRAYNRARYWKERQQLLQDWANFSTSSNDPHDTPAPTSAGFFCHGSYVVTARWLQRAPWYTTLHHVG